ncbi:hypothetical protein K435DRAFT_124580, partial [Dendrothele bispora CBS 962.96]
MPSFGDFQPLCTHVPSYTWCNLFYRQIQQLDSSLLTGLSSSSDSAPVGVNPTCGIERVGNDGNIGNIADVVACALSMTVVVQLCWVTNRRVAAVGRTEFLSLLAIYFLTLPFQLLTTGSLLQQGTMPLVILTSIHAGLVAAFFVILLWNAVVATQLVEDGTISSLLPLTILTLAFFAATTYVSLDTGLGFTSALGPDSSDPLRLRNVALFVLTSVWPAASALFFLLIISYIVLFVLSEPKAVWFYVLASALFVLS